MGIAIAIVVLGCLVFFHELGHFVVAKLCGVGIIRFSLGFGPVVVKKVVGNTEYAISLIPLGGYVKMVNEVPDAQAILQMSGLTETHRFDRKPVWQRALIVIAGPAANIVLAMVLLTASYAWYGIPTLTTRVGEVMENTPAARAGILKGDVIFSAAVADENPHYQALKTFEDFQKFIAMAKDQEILLRVARTCPEKAACDITNVIRVRPEQIKGTNMFGEPVMRYIIGIVPAEPVFERNSLRALVEGPLETWQFSLLTAKGIGKLVTGSFSKESIAGPIGIVDFTSTASKAGGLRAVLWVAMILSINLGVFNMLPVPPLDGGHLPWLVGELVLGRPVSVRIRSTVSNIGAFLLIAFILFACYNDIVRLFTKLK